MVANKYVPIENVVSAFDHQIGQLIFGISLDIFIFLTKFPIQMVEWEQMEVLDHKLTFCYYVHSSQSVKLYLLLNVKNLENKYRIVPAFQVLF